MKILQLVQKPQRRGAEVFAHQISAELRRQGQDVFTVYLYPYDGPNSLPRYERDSILNGNERHPFERLPGVHPVLLRQLLEILCTFEPDVVQVNGASTVKYGAFARMACPQRPWVLIYRNIGNPQDWVRGIWRRLFYQRLVMPQVDGVVGVSQATLANVSSFYQLPIPKQCIRNGVVVHDKVALAPNEIRHLTQTPIDSRVLLFVGSLSVEKRIDRLLRAACQVHDKMPDVHVWIVGDGSLRQQLQKQAISMGLSGNVHFLGTRNDVASFMVAADLLLLTSDTEGIPAVVLEAGAHGLPVIATRVGGMAECVRENETGLLVDREDETGLAAAILELLEKPARRLAMGQQAMTWIRANFAMEYIAQQYLDFYKQVVAIRFKQ